MGDWQRAYAIRDAILQVKRMTYLPCPSDLNNKNCVLEVMPIPLNNTTPQAYICAVINPGIETHSDDIEGFPSNHSCLTSSRICSICISSREGRNLPLHNNYRSEEGGWGPRETRIVVPQAALLAISDAPPACFLRGTHIVAAFSRSLWFPTFRLPVSPPGRGRLQSHWWRQAPVPG